MTLYNPIRARAPSDAKTDRRAASIDAPLADGDSRRRSTRTDAVDDDTTPTDALEPTSVRREHNATPIPTRIRTRDDEDALERARTLTGRRVGAARDDANARWGSSARC